MTLVRSFGFLGIFFILAYASFVHAADRIATAEDCAKLAMTAPGAPCAVGQTQYDPSSPYTGDEVAEATKFLLERNGTGERGVIKGCYQYRPGLDKSPQKPQADRILKLNPQFRVSLYKAIIDMEKQNPGRNTIQSGYRCDGSGGNHPRGCAADIIWGSCWQKTPGDTVSAWNCSSYGYNAGTNSWPMPEQKWIDANGKKYGIQLRLRGDPEGHHVEPTNTSGCIIGPQVALSSSSASPSSAFTNAIRQALGVPPQPAYQQPILPMQPYAQTQPIVNAFNTPVMPTSSPIVTTANPGGVSDSLYVDIQKTTATGTSLADKLEQLAFGTTTATSSTGAKSALPIIINPYDTNDFVSTSSIPAAIVNVATITPHLAVQNTFVANDLDSRGASSLSASQSTMLQTLAQIKTTLLSLLQYLKPFGAHIPVAEYEVGE